MIGKTKEQVVEELQKAGTPPDALEKIAPHKVVFI